jgi:hypothetical protein
MHRGRLHPYTDHCPNEVYEASVKLGEQFHDGEG